MQDEFNYILRLCHVIYDHNIVRPNGVAVASWQRRPSLLRMRLVLRSNKNVHIAPAIVYKLEVDSCLILVM